MTFMSFGSLARWILLVLGCSLPWVMTGCGCGGGGGDSSGTSTEVETSVETGFGPNRDGKVMTDLTGVDEEARAIAVQKDGRIILAGHTATGQVALVRYSADGALDPSFGTNGIWLGSFLGKSATVNAVVLDDSERIVVCGCWDYNMGMVLRFVNDGYLDVSFGALGMVLPMGSFSEATGVAIDGQGRVVVAGYRTNQKSNGTWDDDFVVVRLTSGGLLDTTFGDSQGKDGGRTGSAVIDFKSSSDTAFPHDQAHALAILPGDEVVVAGHSRVRFAFARLLENGVLNSRFGENGKRVVVLDKYNVFRLRGQSLRVGTDDFVLAGFVEYYPVSEGPKQTASPVDSDFAVVRMSKDGSFARYGLTDVGSLEDRAYALVLQEGKMVLAGSTRTAAGLDFAVVRHNSDGSPDSSFGENGILKLALGSQDDEARAMALLPDGRLLVAGYAKNGKNKDFALVRIPD